MAHADGSPITIEEIEERQRHKSKRLGGYCAVSDKNICDGFTILSRMPCQCHCHEQQFPEGLI
jgi:hypothetical protein